MSFITKLFGGGKKKAQPTITIPSVSQDPEPDPKQKFKRGARLALFQTGGGAFGVQGDTPTARRKLLGN